MELPYQNDFSDQNRITILVIDADIDERRCVVKALRRFTKPGIDCLEAEDVMMAARQLDMIEVDLIMTDLALPSCIGLNAFNRVKRIAASVPIVVFTSLDDDAMMTAAMGAGAQDFVSKVGSSPHELRRALVLAHLRHHADGERHRLREQLEETQRRLAQVEGMLPVCSYCKRIRNGRGQWEEMELYVSTHSRASITHGMCPSCFDRVSAGLPG